MSEAGLEALIQAAQFLEENGGMLYYIFRYMLQFLLVYVESSLI